MFLFVCPLCVRQNCATSSAVTWPPAAWDESRLVIRITIIIYIISSLLIYTLHALTPLGRRARAFFLLG